MNFSSKCVIVSSHNFSIHENYMKYFKDTLHELRWDDHRYYHHSRVNQSLHLFSALSFLVAYVVMFFDPIMATLIGWLIAMSLRQAGHFFFEPKGFDEINQASHEYKESIKVGYNLRRKVLLYCVWIVIPIIAKYAPESLNWLVPETYQGDYWSVLGASWLILGVTGLLFRVVQLWWQQNLPVGLIWMIKILTDPFHDVILYHKAPIFLLKGQWLDPMTHVNSDRSH
jgi:hypothetical protein